MVKLANEKIYQVLGFHPTLFIPPFEAFNSATIQALKSNGFIHMSASTDTDFPYYNVNPDEDLWRFPAGSFTTDQFFNPYNYTQTLELINEQKERDGFAVVGMYPNDFINK